MARRQPPPKRKEIKFRPEEWEEVERFFERERERRGWEDVTDCLRETVMKEVRKPPRKR